MITLDQIRQLDHKVRKAIDKINTLNSENNMLQEKLGNYQLRIEELEVLIDTFKKDQGEIENGIIEALNQLDILEDNIVVPGADSGLAQEATVDQLNADLDITEETTEEAVESEDQEETEDSNNEEPESADSSENKESELDIF